MDNINPKRISSYSEYGGIQFRGKIYPFILLAKQEKNRQQKNEAYRYDK
jgi:hypothetical protein